MSWQEVYPLPKVNETLAQLAFWCYHFHSPRHQQWILANSSQPKVLPVNNFYHPIWALLFLQTPVQNLKRSRAFSMENVKNTEWISRYGMQDG